MSSIDSLAKSLFRISNDIYNICWRDSESWHVHYSELQPIAPLRGAVKYSYWLSGLEFMSEYFLVQISPPTSSVLDVKIRVKVGDCEMLIFQIEGKSVSN